MDSREEHTSELVYLIRKLMQSGEIYTKELNKRFNVSAPQVASLLVLYEAGAMSPSHLARRIMVKSSTVTGIIDRLEHKGLVTRVRNSPDRRVITIELTQEGRDLAQNAPPPIQMKIVQGLNKMGNDERKEIIKSLAKLAEMIDREDLDEESGGL